MKQFKAEWQGEGGAADALVNTILHIITQHNKLCDFLVQRKGEEELEQRASLLKNATYTSDDGWHITLPKPEWMKDKVECLTTRHIRQQGYIEALSDASKASGITYKLED